MANHLALRLIPWLMDDVLHLRIPASWAWPARHTNSLRFWLGNFNDGFHQFGDPWGGHHCGGGHCEEWKPFGEKLGRKKPTGIKNERNWSASSWNPLARWTRKPLKQVQLDLTCQRWRSGILVSGGMLPFFWCLDPCNACNVQTPSLLKLLLKGHQSSNGRDWSTSSWVPELHWWRWCAPKLTVASFGGFRIHSLESASGADIVPELRKEQWKQWEIMWLVGHTPRNSL